MVFYFMRAKNFESGFGEVKVAYMQSITVPETGAVCIFSGMVRGETHRDGNPSATVSFVNRRPSKRANPASSVPAQITPAASCSSTRMSMRWRRGGWGIHGPTRRWVVSSSHAAPMRAA